ncbi:hypothetical protein PAB09_10745 [Corynebacterium sp. SCR221107]|nr:hypothetical protein [Corynebacterium sp. SCR221107]WBT08343.1 hypothetical protein PAB09_10745 [Corynebacterium sp. SCR221107]
MAALLHTLPGLSRDVVRRLRVRYLHVILLADAHCVSQYVTAISPARLPG